MMTAVIVVILVCGALVWASLVTFSDRLKERINALEDE